MKKYAMGGPMTTTSETTKKPLKKTFKSNPDSGGKVPMPQGRKGTPMPPKGLSGKAKNGKSFAALAPPYDKATYADKIAGATKKKMQYGGKAASMAPMKSGGMMKKAMMGSSLMGDPMMKSGGKVKKGMHKMPDGSTMKNSAMKSGGSMKKCKYGCK